MITKYGQNQAGGHHFGVTCEGIEVLVRSNDAETDVRAEKVARRIESTITDYSEAREIEREGKRLRDNLHGLIRERDTRVSELRQALEAATTGRRRFFGPVLLVPAVAGAWDGPVWLQDPEKRDRGYALRFASLAEVRELHPELWITGVNEHGIMLDAARLPTPAPFVSPEAEIP